VGPETPPVRRGGWWRARISRGKRTALGAAARFPALRRFELELTVDLYGGRVVVPVANGRGPEHRDITEPHLLAALRAALGTRSGCFVDVGAYTGQTLVKLLIVDPHRRYVGFEPQLGAADYVRLLLEANGGNGEVVAAALGERNGPVDLLLAGELGGEFHDGASVVDGFRPSHHYAERRVVPMLRGDDALAGLGGQVAVIKIDVEGAELDVLRGLLATLKRDRPVIFLEVLPFGGATNVATLRARRAAELRELLEQAGYRMLAIEASSALAPAEQLGGVPEAGGGDYVCVLEHEVDDFATGVERCRRPLDDPAPPGPTPAG